MNLNKAARRHRLDSCKSNTTHRFLDGKQEVPRSGSHNETRIALFSLDLRKILRDFLSSIAVDLHDIEFIAEVVIDRFLNGNSIRSWRWTTHYRHIVLKILIETANSQTNESCEIVPFTKQFSMVWREHLLAQSWERLRQKEIESGWPYFTVLRCRYQNPSLTNEGLIRELSCVLKSNPTKQTFRVFLYRCERRLAREVNEAVMKTIHLPTPIAIESELAALDLLQHSIS